MQQPIFDIRDMAELSTPVGLYGAMHQVEVAGDMVFSIVIGIVLSEPAPTG
ncbi:hypothetical protein [Sphingomonas cavernae]|uniref:hypothetical protein n=1 Tax=Sphingomonas cavernae TaxID=2320861 RepID=UPI0015FF75E0|nr:hypothetical protein [Sphingomonas cavernae]